MCGREVCMSSNIMYAYLFACRNKCFEHLHPNSSRRPILNYVDNRGTIFSQYIEEV